MPALNISAVNAGTDQLTITAHGLVTGDGPAAMFAASAGAVLPGGTAAVTDYWVIRVDDNTVKLATSSTNAMAGTAIDITDAGSGTLQLLIGVPYRRPRTYLPSSMGVAGSQLKSADLNAFSDTFVAIWNLLTGQPQSVWERLEINAPPDSSASFDDVEVTGDLRYRHGSRSRTLAGSACTASPPANAAMGTLQVQTTGAVTLFYQLPILEPGERILTVNFELADTGAPTGTSVTATVGHYTEPGAGSVSLGTVMTTSTTTPVSVPITVTPTKLTTDDVFGLSVVIAATGVIVNRVRVTFDRVDLQ